MGSPGRSSPLLGTSVPLSSPVGSNRRNTATLLGIEVAACNTEVLRRYLRVIQIGLYICTALFGLLVCVAVTVTWQDLDEKCPLYATPGQSVTLTHSNHTLFLHTDEVQFGDLKTCYYCIYVNLAASTYALIWGFIYGIVTSSTKLRQRHLHRLIFPSLLFNAVLFTCEVISSCVLTLGFKHWCKELIKTVQKATMATKFKVPTSCGALQRLPWRTHNSHVHYLESSRLLSLLTFAQFSSWILSFCTLLLSLICAERFFKFIWYGDASDSRKGEKATIYRSLNSSTLKSNGMAPSTIHTTPQLRLHDCNPPPQQQSFSTLLLAPASSGTPSFSDGEHEVDAGRLSTRADSPVLEVHIQSNPNAIASDSSSDSERGPRRMEFESQNGDDVSDQTANGSAALVAEAVRRALIGPLSNSSTAAPVSITTADRAVLISWSPPSSPEKQEINLKGDGRRGKRRGEDRDMQEQLIHDSPNMQGGLTAERRKSLFRFRRKRHLAPEDVERVSSV